MTHPPEDGGQPPAAGRHSSRFPRPYPTPGPVPGPAPLPYGQPWGADPSGPTTTPARKRRTGPILALVLLAVLVAAAAVLLPRVLATRVLDRTATQRDVARQFEERQGVRITLTCGEAMALRTGATYSCSGTTAQGEAVTLRIRITDAASARYTWAEG